MRSQTIAGLLSLKQGRLHGKYIRSKLVKLLVFGAGEGIRTLDPNLGKVGVGVFPSFLKFAHD